MNKVIKTVQLVKYNLTRNKNNLATTHFVAFWNLLVNVFETINITISSKTSELSIVGNIDKLAKTNHDQDEIDHSIKILRSLLPYQSGIQFVRNTKKIFHSEINSITDYYYSSNSNSSPIPSIAPLHTKNTKGKNCFLLNLYDIKIWSSPLLILSALINMGIVIIFVSILKGTEHYILLKFNDKNQNKIIEQKELVVKLLQTTPNLSGKLIDIELKPSLDSPIQSIQIQNYQPIPKSFMHYFISTIPNFIQIERYIP